MQDGCTSGFGRFQPSPTMVAIREKCTRDGKYLQVLTRLVNNCLIINQTTGVDPSQAHSILACMTATYGGRAFPRQVVPPIAIALMILTVIHQTFTDQ
jgi:hypothetical protein